MPSDVYPLALSLSVKFSPFALSRSVKFSPFALSLSKGLGSRTVPLEHAEGLRR